MVWITLFLCIFAGALCASQNIENRFKQILSDFHPQLQYVLVSMGVMILPLTAAALGASLHSALLHCLVSVMSFSAVQIFINRSPVPPALVLGAALGGNLFLGATLLCVFTLTTLLMPKRTILIAACMLPLLALVVSGNIALWGFSIFLAVLLFVPPLILSAFATQTRLLRAKQKL